jgi:hypothetical protein
MMVKRLVLFCFLVSSVGCERRHDHHDSIPEGTTVTRVSSGNDVAAEVVISETNCRLIEKLDSALANGEFTRDTKSTLFELSKHDVDAAIEIFEKGLSSSKRFGYELILSEFLRLGCENGKADKMLCWLGKHKELHTNGNLSQFFEWLTSHNPAMGMKYYDEFIGNARSRLLKIGIAELAAGDIEGAFRFAESLTDKEDVENGYGMLVVLASKRQMFEEAILALGKLPADLKMRRLLLVKTMMQWVGQDPEKAYEKMGTFSPADMGIVLNDPMALDLIVNTGGVEQFDKLLGGIPVTSEFIDVYKKVAIKATRVDPVKAVIILNSLPKSSMRSDLIASVFEEVSRLDPTKAMELVTDLPESERQMGTRGVVRAVASSGFSKAVEIAEGSASEHRQDLFREIGRVSAYENTVNAVKMIESQELSEIMGSGFREQMLENTVQHWAKRDREAALAWVEKLPMQDLPKGVTGLMVSWLKADPVAASQWLAKQPAGPARDAGARVIIDQIKNTDPLMADQWQKSLSQPPEIHE